MAGGNGRARGGLQLYVKGGGDAILSMHTGKGLGHKLPAPGVKAAGPLGQGVAPPPPHLPLIGQWVVLSVQLAHLDALGVERMSVNLVV